jgi:hypothetical protein
MVLLELGLLITVQTVYDKKNNKFNSFALEKLKEQFYIKYRKDSILAQVLHLMLESDDSIRPDFIKLKERMPKLEQVKNYIQSQRNLALSAGNASNPGNGPSIIVEKQSFVENPLARPPNDRVALPGTALYQPVGRPSQNESIMNPQSPSTNTPGQNPEFRRPLSHADRIPSQLNFENGESPGAPRDDRPPGMSDSNYNKAKSEYSAVQLASPSTSKTR